MLRPDPARWLLVVALAWPGLTCTWFGPEKSEEEGQAAPATAERSPSKEDPSPATPSPAVEPSPEANEVDPSAKAAEPSGAEPTPPGRPATPTFTRALAAVREYPRLHPLAYGHLLLSVGPQIYVVEPGKALIEDPLLLAGLPTPLCPLDGAIENWLWDLGITGRWPDAIFASIWVAAPPNAPPVARRTFRRRDGVFAPLTLGGGEFLFYYVEGRPYVDGSILSLRRYQALPPKGIRMSDCNEDPTYRKCDARFDAVRRKAESSKPLVVTRGLPKGPDLAGLLGRRPPLLATFDSLPSGHVFAATDERTARMLMVSPGRASLVALPGSTDALRLHQVKAYAPDRVFAAGGTGGRSSDPTPRLYRYDGRTWAELTPPPCELYTELWYFEQLTSGERYALCANEPEDEDSGPYDLHAVWWQPPAGEWIELDQKANALARRGEDIWVVDHNGAYTTAALGGEITATSREALERRLLADGPPCLGVDRNW